MQELPVLIRVALLTGVLSSMMGCTQPGAPQSTTTPAKSASAATSSLASSCDASQKGRIVGGESVEGVKLQMSQADVEKILGKGDVDRFSSQIYLSYYDKGIEVALNDGKVGQITCHVKKDKWQTYPGGTKEGLWVGSQRADFEKALGNSHSFPDALKFPNQGLWIRFDKDGLTDTVTVYKGD
jgi:hypothetical protein